MRQILKFTIFEKGDDASDLIEVVADKSDYIMFARRAAVTEYEDLLCVAALDDDDEVLFSVGAVEGMRNIRAKGKTLRIVHLHPYMTVGCLHRKE